MRKIPSQAAGGLCQIIESTGPGLMEVCRRGCLRRSKSGGPWDCAESTHRFMARCWSGPSFFWLLRIQPFALPKNVYPLEVEYGVAEFPNDTIIHYRHIPDGTWLRLMSFVNDADGLPKTVAQFKCHTEMQAGVSPYAWRPVPRGLIDTSALRDTLAHRNGILNTLARVRSVSLVSRKSDRVDFWHNAFSPLQEMGQQGLECDCVCKDSGLIVDVRKVRKQWDALLDMYRKGTV